jgi:hypothetical protein
MKGCKVVIEKTRVNLHPFSELVDVEDTSILVDMVLVVYVLSKLSHQNAHIAVLEMVSTVIGFEL